MAAVAHGLPASSAYAPPRTFPRSSAWDFCQHGRALLGGGVLTGSYSGKGAMAKILVIDDEAVVRTLLEILLSQQGYEVVLADGGWKGLELFRQEHPDVVVLDLNMPEMDGVTVLKHIRRIDLNQPVIILTGAATPETEQQVRALGATEIVEKDFTSDFLGAALKRALTTPSLQHNGGSMSLQSHSVQFYNDDTFLTQSLARFITEGLQGNETVIIVATAQHREALQQVLPPEQVTHDKLRFFNAEEQLSQFLDAECRASHSLGRWWRGCLVRHVSLVQFAFLVKWWPSSGPDATHGRPFGWKHSGTNYLRNTPLRSCAPIRCRTFQKPTSLYKPFPDCIHTCILNSSSSRLTA